MITMEAPERELTEREIQIVLLIADDLSNARIGARLFLAENTVKTHVQRILKAWNCHSRTALAVQAFHRGLIKPDPSKVRA